MKGIMCVESRVDDNMVNGSCVYVCVCVGGGCTVRVITWLRDVSLQIRGDPLRLYYQG